METWSRDSCSTWREKNQTDEDVAGTIALNILLGCRCLLRSVETDALVLSFPFFRGVDDFQWERAEQDTEIRDHMRSFHRDRLWPISELGLYPKT